MATNETLKNQVTTKQKNEVANGKKPMTINDYIDQMAPAMAQALPKHMSVERMTRMATTVIRTTPQLKEADVSSLLGAVMQSAQLGLEPGPMGHCYFLPFKNNKEIASGSSGSSLLPVPFNLFIKNNKEITPPELRILPLPFSFQFLIKNIIGKGSCNYSEACSYKKVVHSINTLYN